MLPGRWLMALGVGFLCLMLAGCGSSGPTVNPTGGTGGSTTLTSQRSLQSYQLTSDAGGAATVLWVTEKFVGPEHLAAAVLRVRQQSTRGWSTPVQVGGVKETDDEQLVESASGAAAIVWYYVQGGPHFQTVLMVSTRSSADGAWSTPTRLWSAPNAGGLMMAVSIDSAGVATVAWAGYGKTNPAIWVDTVNAHGGHAARPEQVVAARGGGTDLNLAENASGAAVLSWQRELSPAKHPAMGSLQRCAEVAVQRSAASGRWSKAQRLGTFSVPVEGVASRVWTPVAPSSVLTANGTAAVGWRAGGAGRKAPLEVSTRTPGSAKWSASHTLTGNPGGYGLVAGANNQLVAVWSTATAKQRALFTSTAANGNRWSAPTQFAGVHDGTYGPVLAAAANGLIALTPLTGNHQPIQYATRSPTGLWSALTRVGTGDNPEVTVTSGGAVTVLWETFSQQGPYRLEIRTQQR